jgi:hypothetical protein
MAKFIRTFAVVFALLISMNADVAHAKANPCKAAQLAKASACKVKKTNAQRKNCKKKSDAYTACVAARHHH